MPCGPDCACLAEPGVECLSVVDPARFGHFADWCRSGDPHRRAHVLARSRLGIDPPAPGPVTKARNFARAAVKHIAAGLPLASPELAESRLAACRACERFDATRQSCTLCGCQMRIKTTWAEQACPEGRW